MALNVPIRPEPLSTQVARQIENLITSGVWPVGSRIPAEKDLVSQLLVSRNTVREALRSLVHTGMIEARVGDGTYVRSLTELAAPLARRAQGGSLTEAIQELAALGRTKKEVSRLRQCLSAQKAAIVSGDRASYTQADAELHRIVVACARNQ